MWRRKLERPVWKHPLVLLAMLAAPLVGVGLMRQPATVRVERSAHLAAPPAATVALLTDLQRWPSSWPGQDPDPTLERRFGGPPVGLGASCYWSGADHAGRLTVVDAAEDRVGLELELERPRRSSFDITFALVPEGSGTRVTCAVERERDLIDRIRTLVGATDATAVDQGLALLVARAEAGPAVGTYRVERSIVVSAPATAVRPWLIESRRWASWSPWERRDGATTRSFGGPGAGAGASYYWAGTAPPTRGRLTMLASSGERVVLELERDGAAPESTDLALILTPEGAGSRVTWIATGERDGGVASEGAAAAAAAEALARLKAEVEGMAAPQRAMDRLSAPAPASPRDRGRASRRAARPGARTAGARAPSRGRRRR